MALSDTSVAELITSSLWSNRLSAAGLPPCSVRRGRECFRPAPSNVDNLQTPPGKVTLILFQHPGGSTGPFILKAHSRARAVQVRHLPGSGCAAQAGHEIFCQPMAQVIHDVLRPNGVIGHTPSNGATESLTIATTARSFGSDTSCVVASTV